MTAGPTELPAGAQELERKAAGLREWRVPEEIDPGLWPSSLEGGRLVLVWAESTRAVYETRERERRRIR